MNKEQQDLAWLCLPKEIRDEIKEIYQAKVNSVYDTEIYQELILDEIFGIHNLTSDIEPEEMLMVERKKVIEKCNKVTNDYAETGDKWCSGYIKSLNDFFGDKCLPEEKSCTESEKIIKDIEEFHSNYVEQ